MSATQEPIYVGDQVVLRATIKNRAGVLADPTSATGRVVHVESGSTQDLVYSQSGTGVWEASWTPNKDGDHFFSCDAAGAIVKSGEKSVRVAKRRVPQP